VEASTRVSARVREVRQERRPELKATQDTRENSRVLETIYIDPLEGYPAAWEGMGAFRCSQCSGANVVGVTLCYHRGGEFVIHVPEAVVVTRPLRNSAVPKALPTPPPGTWPNEPHPEAASSRTAAGAVGVSPAVSVPIAKEPTEAEKMEKQLQRVVKKHSSGGAGKTTQAHVLDLKTCLKLLRPLGRKRWNLEGVCGVTSLSPDGSMPYARCPRLIDEIVMQDDWWNHAVGSRAEHWCLISVAQYTAMSQKSRESRERLFGDKKRARVEHWMADDQRRVNANITMAQFSRDRCDRFDSGKPRQEVFEDPVQFAEDPSWSTIALKGIEKLPKYPRTSQARESLMPLLAEWKAALRGTSPRCLFSIPQDGMGDSLLDELGCTTTQGMEGVYCFPLRGSDGKADWNKSVGYCSLVPLNNIGVLFQAMIVLMVGYAGQPENRAQMQTDQRGAFQHPDVSQAPDAALWHALHPSRPCFYVELGRGEIGFSRGFVKMRCGDMLRVVGQLVLGENRTARVLNTANANNPGGGVWHGRAAQEE
jgi:hypothetical protein